MSPTWYAVRSGLVRGLIEFRQGVTNVQDLLFYLITPVLLLVPLYFLRHTDVPGTSLPVATLAIPGVFGMLLAYGAMVLPATVLTTEREDGTLLRAKALPYGTRGYLTGLIVRHSLEITFAAALVLVPAMLIFDGVAPRGLAGWLTLVGVAALGLVAVLPLGFVIGALAESPRSVGGLGLLFTAALVAISGIFYPVTALAGWVQAIAQVFPTYWVGLGMRAAMLPETAVAVEVGQSWRTLEMVLVLAAWAVVGLVLAPAVLRRMARRESGARMEERRRAALQRSG